MQNCAKRQTNTKRWVKPISPRTVRRQLNIIQGVFQAAIEYRDGFSSLPNHFLGIRVQGSIGGRRERSLEGDELERILKACEKCRIPNNYYVPLAIHLGIDTGMRRQEIFNLVWADIDDNNRRIKIRKSKTDKATGKTDGTMIVLPAKAKMLLVTLVMALIADAGPELLAEAGFKDQHDEWEFPQDDDVRIFPMTEEAFTQSWSDARTQSWSDARSRRLIKCAKDCGHYRRVCCLIFAPMNVTMSQKLTLIQSARSPMSADGGHCRGSANW